MTEWNEYRSLDFDRLKQTMQGNTFVDLRNVYDKPHLESLGFSYTCVGR
jgi:UDPglucose 6-dehydrogenase